MKNTTLPLAAAALLVAACAADPDPAQEFRDALPKTAAVEVGTPQTEEGAAAVGVRADALGDSPIAQSEYAVTSYYLALTLNGGVGWTLRLLQFVTAFPPTSCGDDACTWGPWVDDDGLNRWKLEVSRAGEGYDYALSAQPGSSPTAPFATLLTGTAFPVDRDHGSGSFTIDFDAQDALDHGALWEKTDFGQVEVRYDNTRNVSLTAVFTGAHKDDADRDPSNDHLVNAAYAFDDAPSGGELQVAFADLTTAEQIALRTRWSAGGAGRADARYRGPDGLGGTAEFAASECWAGHAADFAEVYDSKHPEIPELADESACSPFSAALPPDLAVP